MRLTGQALLFTSLVSLGCVGESVPVTPDDTEQPPTSPDGPAIDDYLDTQPKLPTSPPLVIEGLRSAPQDDGTYSCSTQSFKETRQFDKIVAFVTNSESLWPGALVAGDSLYEGLFTQVVLPRRPINMSVSLENLDGAKSDLLEEPSLSSFREAVTEILAAKVTGATPANIYSEIEQVHSDKQLSLALGAELSWLNSAASIKSSFDFSQRNVRSRYLVRYTQAYYTADIDQPGKPSDFFSDEVTAADVKDRVGPDSPLLYVSSVTYGRMVLFTFASQYSSDELGAALEFAYSGGIAASAEVAASYKTIISKSSITAYILGGSGGDAAMAIDGYEGLMAFLKKGGDYSRQSPGAPIAYKLAYLADNQPARMSLTTDYSVKQCDRIGQKVKVTLKSIRVASAGGDSGKDLEIYGTIWAASDTAKDLFVRGKDNYKQIAQGATWPPVGFISEESIQVTPREGSVIHVGANLWDDDGRWSSADDLSGDGEQSMLTIPFETGWRRDVVLHLTGDGADVEVTVGIEPI